MNNMSPRYTWIERRKIHRRAKQILGYDDSGEYEDFMMDCIDGVMGDLEATDEDDAREICQLMWDEENG